MDEKKEAREPEKRKAPKYVQGIGKNGQVLYYTPINAKGVYSMGRAARRELERIKKRARRKK